MHNLPPDLSSRSHESPPSLEPQALPSKKVRFQSRSAILLSEECLRERQNLTARKLSVAPSALLFLFLPRFYDRETHESLRLPKFASRRLAGQPFSRT